MDFRYKWKRGRTPTPDEAMRDSALLDESQFDSKQDWEMVRTRRPPTSRLTLANRG
uniref:Uncharacterized protein n=1 Tax=Desertifilum tharense IPPAS B-1220 TaxID=1781255 RepID=A0ACD5GXZ8_9CYAN